MPSRDTNPLSKNRNGSFGRYVRDIVKRTMKNVSASKNHVFPYKPQMGQGLGIRRDK